MPKTFSTVILSILLLTICMSCLQPKRPQALDLFTDTTKAKDVQLPVPESRTMTILLGSSNKVLYYLGNPDKPLEGPAVTGHGKDSLGKAIISAMSKMKKDTESYLIVLIKPSEKSTYKNFVNTVDILNIVGVKSRAVVDITPKEVAALKKYNIY